MRKRLLVLAGVALAAAVIVAGALVVHAYRQKLARGRLIDLEHCLRIKKGMRQDEVEAILGGPPGDFTTKVVVFLDFRGHFTEPVGRQESWCGDKGRILVEFDKHGTVRCAYFEDDMSFRAARVERLRARLRRVWP
jgi:hypothetical protein